MCFILMQMFFSLLEGAMRASWLINSENRCYGRKCSKCRTAYL